VHADSPGERELLERILSEDPETRAARRAHERWVTSRRLWATIDSSHITDDGERAQFIASRLWPDMPQAWVEALVATIRRGAADGRHVRRPERIEDVVGPRLAALMRAHGYPGEVG
jgi:hypothetical protein